MLKKLLFSAAIVMPLSASALAGNNGPVQTGQDGVGSIDDLRRLCQNLERNEQINLFNKGLICKGSFTTWQQRRGSEVLPNRGTLDAVTSYVKRDDPLSTPGVHLSFETERNGAQCNIYDKIRIHAPQTPVYVNSCEELTSANVESLCRDVIAQQCSGANDPFDTEQQDQRQQSGACTMEHVGSFNTCDLYNNQCDNRQQGPEQRQQSSSSSEVQQLEDVVDAESLHTDSASN